MATLSAIVGVASLVITIIGVTAKTTAVIGTVSSIEQLLDGSAVTAFNRFDTAFAKMIYNLSNLLTQIYDYTKIILLAAAFLAIIFYAFKLLLGTIEIKKTFAEMIFKFTVVMIVMFTYPSIISKTFELATQLGVEVSGGSEFLVQSLGSLASQTSSISNATKDIKQILSRNIDKNNYKNWSVDEHVITAFCQVGMTKEEAMQWAHDNGIGINSNTSSTTSNFWNGTDHVSVDTEKYIQEQYDREREAYLAVVGDYNKSKLLKQQISMIKKLSVILTGYDALSLDELIEADPELATTAPTFNNLLNNSEAVLEKIFSSVYLPNTTTLSSGNLMYMAIIVSELLSEGTLSYLDESEGDGSDMPNMSWSSLIESNDKNLFVRFLSWVLKSFVYKFGIIFAVIFVMCEYYLTIIEYFIVTSLSCLLIPLFFIDATKSFATNILKMLLSYFFKLLTTAFMCFFVMSFFLNCCGNVIASTNLTSTSNFVYYLFILILGMTLAKSSGKIASAVVSGNPNIGLGDLANEFRAFSGAMRTASHEIEKAGKSIGEMGKKMQPGIETAQAAGDAKALARQKANDTFDDMRKNTPGFTMSEAEQKQEVDKIASKAGRDFWKQALENKGYKMLHGHGAAGVEIGEDGKLHAKGYAMPGTQYWDKDKEHFVDVNSQNAKYYNKGSDAAKKAEEIAKMYTSTPNSGTGTKSEQHINPGRDDFPDEDTSAHD